MKKIIFLVDMNAFFASVHQAENKELKNKPLIVAGDKEKRTGIVLAKSYECLAKAPIKTAMTLKEALTLLPDVMVVKPDHALYSAYSKKVRKILADFSPLVEPFSIDEAFLDMSGTEKLFGKPEEAARKIQERILKELDLPCSVGIGANKLCAKMASNFKKPLGISTLWPEEIEEKMFPLSVAELFGVGPATLDKLEKMNILTIGQLAKADPDFLEDKLGKHGSELKEAANGNSSDKVEPEEYEKIKSIGNSRTLSKDYTELSELKRAFYDICELVGERVRQQKMWGYTVTVTLKDKDFKVRNHSRTLNTPINLTEDIYETVLILLEEMWCTGQAIRLIGVSLDHLCISGEQQLSFLEDKEKIENLNSCMDSIRGRFGRKSIIKGRSMMPGSLGDRYVK